MEYQTMLAIGFVVLGNVIHLYFIFRIAKALEELVKLKRGGN